MGNIGKFVECGWMENENKKNQKKISNNDFNSKAKIFRKNFLQKNRETTA